MAVFASFFEKHFSKNSTKQADAASNAAKNVGAEISREDRTQQREKFYHIVRDCIARAGVLTGGYKFKVLSHDRGDSSFIVMVDLAPSYISNSAQLREIELHMAKMAELFMSALAVRVYWRVNESLEIPVQSASVPQLRKAAVQPAPEPYAPISPEEIAAFKKAYFAPAASTPAPRPQRESRSSARNAPLELGATQFGELI